LQIPVVLNVNNSTADQLNQQNGPILCQAVISLDGVKHISNLRKQQYDCYILHEKHAENYNKAEI